MPGNRVLTVEVVSWVVELAGISVELNQAATVPTSIHEEKNESIE